MLPVMQVLISEDTIQQWMDRNIAEARLDVRLAGNAGDLTILKVDPKKADPRLHEHQRVGLGRGRSRRGCAGGADRSIAVIGTDFTGRGSSRGTEA